jgi:hypothetical protein
MQINMIQMHPHELSGRNAFVIGLQRIELSIEFLRRAVEKPSMDASWYVYTARIAGRLFIEMPFRN